MKELFERNRMNWTISRLSTMIFFLWKFNIDDWVFHSVVTCGTELCKRTIMLKMRLATTMIILWDWCFLVRISLHRLCWLDFKLLKYFCKFLFQLLKCFFNFQILIFEGKIAKIVHLLCLINLTVIMGSFWFTWTRNYRDALQEMRVEFRKAIPTTKNDFCF